MIQKIGEILGIEKQELRRIVLTQEEMAKIAIEQAINAVEPAEPLRERTEIDRQNLRQIPKIWHPKH